MAVLQGLSLKIYLKWNSLSDLSCGLHQVGGMTLATTPERLDYLRATRAKHRHLGLDTHLTGPEEIRKRAVSSISTVSWTPCGTRWTAIWDRAAQRIFTPPPHAAKGRRFISKPRSPR